MTSNSPVIVIDDVSAGAVTTTRITAVVNHGHTSDSTPRLSDSTLTHRRDRP